MTRTLLAGLLLAATCGGCSKFPGEWLEEGTFARDGTLQPVEGNRRAALRFEWPSTVRYGKYVNAAGVVDQQGMQFDTYFTMSGGNVAQFGSTIARVHGDQLTTYVGAEPNRQFVRVKHRPRIFPPAAILPTLAKKTPGARQPGSLPAVAGEPLYASMTPPQVVAPGRASGAAVAMEVQGD